VTEVRKTRGLNQVTGGLDFPKAPTADNHSKGGTEQNKPDPPVTHPLRKTKRPFQVGRLSHASTAYDPDLVIVRLGVSGSNLATLNTPTNASSKVCYDTLYIKHQK